MRTGQEHLHIATDAELSAMLLRSKAEADRGFTEVYARYAQRIYAYCLRVLGSTEEANDIFQDVMTRFFRSVQSGQAGSVENIGGYLMQIARNLCLNTKRDRKATLNIVDIPLHIAPAGYEREELLALIRNALGCLAIEYRDAFVMKEYEGLSYQEMAEITGETVSTLKNRVWRAKDKVREILAPYIHDIESH